MTDLARPAHRLVYIDNLRWSAICMVVVMHAAVTYSPFGRWYYRDPAPSGLGAKVAFAAYQSLQHAVSMGLLFGIAGFFAAGAVSRKGAGAFMRERLRRLGLPLLAYVTLIGPLTERYVAGSWRSSPQRGFIEDWWRHAQSGALRSGSGPLWFCLVLLVFSAVFALLSRVRPVRRAPRPVPSAAAVLGYAAAMAATTFALGVAWPGAGTVLNLEVHDLPQYPFMFVAGVLAWRGDWLRQLPSRSGRWWLWGGLAGSAVLWGALVALGGALRGELGAYGGGWHWQAAGMDVWRSLTCMALSLGLLTLYRDRFNQQGVVARTLARNAFGVYVLHAPVLIAVTRALHDWPATIGVKFVTASVLAVAASFLLVAALTRSVPRLRAVL